MYSNFSPLAVQIFYKNDTTGTPVELKVPGCISSSGVCSLRKFKKVMAPLTLDENEWLTQCSAAGDYSEAPSQLFRSIKQASDKEKLLKKAKSIGKEIYRQYVQPLILLFF